MADCQGTLQRVQCVAEYLRSCRQCTHLHGWLDCFMVFFRTLMNWRSQEWCVPRVKTKRRSCAGERGTSPTRWRCHCSLARARWRRCDRLTVADAVSMKKVEDRNLKGREQLEEDEDLNGRAHTTPRGRWWRARPSAPRESSRGSSENWWCRFATPAEHVKNQEPAQKPGIATHQAMRQQKAREAGGYPTR